MSSIPIIRRRILFHLGGYDAITPEGFYRRFTRELARSCATWSISATCTPPDIGGANASWRIDAAGPDWVCETSVHLLGWDDLIRADFARSHLSRLWRGALAFADLFASGTALRYLRTNWRYFLFFLFPLIELALILAAALALGNGVGHLFTGPLVLLGVPVVALALWGGYLLACRRYFLKHLIDDWIFACDYARQRRPDVDARVAAFGDEMLRVLATTPADEVVIVGHSMGAMFMVEALAHAINASPRTFAGVPPVRVLAVGSSILKVGLHPASMRLRRAIASVASTAAIKWVEVHAIYDAMNFYKICPVIASGAIDTPGAKRPLIHTVRFSRMLSAYAIRRFFGNFFRLHNQFVMGNDRRFFYDYFLIAAGPISFDTRFESKDTVVGALTAEGALALDALRPDPPQPERSKILKPLMRDR